MMAEIPIPKKNRTRKIFKPNLHSARIEVNGAYKRVKLCTKCQRLFKTQNVKPKIEITTEEIKAPVATV